MLNNLFSLFANSGESGKDIKPSVDPINGKIHYSFQCGIKAYQEELNLDQDTEMTDLMLGFDINSFSLEKSSIKDLIDMLLKEKALSKILDIILIQPEDAPYTDYGKLKNSELAKIFSDFFSLNPTAINWLKTIGSGLTSISQTPSTKSS